MIIALELAPLIIDKLILEIMMINKQQERYEKAIFQERSIIDEHSFNTKEDKGINTYNVCDKSSISFVQILLFALIMLIGLLVACNYESLKYNSKE